MDKIKIFIISQEEPFYVPKVIRHVVENQGSSYQIVGATILKPYRKNKTFKDWLFERTQIYTWWELFITVTLFGLCKFRNILAKVIGSTPYSVDNVYRRKGVQQIHTADINDPNYVSKLRTASIDVILSVSPPQLFKEELLTVAQRYCLNAHGTLLPRHRGVFGSWWTIFKDDKEAGTTIHTMEVRLDAGEILWQESVPVEKGDTQYSIAYKTKSIMAKGLVEVLEKIAKNCEGPIKPTYDESYHRAPTKQQGKEFHAKGKRVISITNFSHVLASRFPV